MGGARSQPCCRIVRMDAAADLQSAGIGCQGAAGRLFIAGAKHDDMAAPEPVAVVKTRIKLCRVITFKIGHQTCAVICQAAADDLFHAAFVKVNTGAE